MKSSRQKIKKIVREGYARAANAPGLGGSGNCFSGFSDIAEISAVSIKLGYTDDQIAFGLGQANFGRGCGNPLIMADLKPGETVVDLGSGTGFDAFLAARSVGQQGRVLGIDMTPEMVIRAGQNAEKFHTSNVEFKLGEIEKLPIPDNSVDAVLSNCVINLSTDKRAVYSEMFRVLKPGGRICISDMLSSREIPKEIKDDPAAYTG